jgi:hypothetical protein
MLPSGTQTNHFEAASGSFWPPHYEEPQFDWYRFSEWKHSKVLPALS